VVACKPQELTRAKATEILTSTVLNKPAYTHNVQSIVIYKVHHIYSPNYYDVMKLAVMAGFFSAHPGKSCGVIRCYDITLTPKGQERSKDWMVTNDSWTISTQRWRFVEVTGIRKENPTACTVIFTWRWEPTEDGKAMGYELSTPQEDGFNFRLFDDGWRAN
jgi:hypothetical protein